jgi:hypothetical protein
MEFEFFLKAEREGGRRIRGHNFTGQHAKAMNGGAACRLIIFTHTYLKLRTIGNILDRNTHLCYEYFDSARLKGQ